MLPAASSRTSRGKQDQMRHSLSLCSRHNGPETANADDCLHIGQVALQLHCIICATELSMSG